MAVLQQGEQKAWPGSGCRETAMPGYRPCQCLGKGEQFSWDFPSPAASEVTLECSQYGGRESYLAEGLGPCRLHLTQ